MNYWWVVANDRDPDHGWNWSTFFSYAHEEGDPYRWGGAKWIKSLVSHKRIEEMREGDLIVTYQAALGVVGFTYLTRDGYRSATGGRHDSFDLDSKRFVSLKNAIPLSTVKELPQARKNFEFVKFQQSTVFRVTPEGFELLLRSVLDANRRQKKAIEKFLSDGGFRPQTCLLD
jgi:hypothetical protein